MLIIFFGISLILTKNPLYSVGCLILVFLCVSIHLAYVGLIYISLTYLIVVRCCGLFLVNLIWLVVYALMCDTRLGKLGNALTFPKSSCLPDPEMGMGLEHAGKVGEGIRYSLLRDKHYYGWTSEFHEWNRYTVTHHSYVECLYDFIQWLYNWAHSFELNESLESQPKIVQANYRTTAGSPKGSNSYGDGVIIVGIRKSSSLIFKGSQNIRTYSTKAAIEQYALDTGVDWLSQMKMNSDGRYHRLYKLISSKELLSAAYNEIKSKPGNITPGTDLTTLDGFSINIIDKLSKSLENETFEFTSVKRVYIPKMNGKIRPLGIPNVKDKVVQKAITILLTLIYEPSFSEKSFGFRPNRSTHSALREISRWNGTTWVIEGDIKGFFDNINHKKLIEIINRKIADQRFIDLIWKLLRAGYLEEGTFKPSTIGVPQGGVISPILSNIYLDVFDKYIEKKISELSSDKRLISKDNPIATKLNWELSKLNKIYDKTKSPETLRMIRKLRSQRNQNSARVRSDVRIRYTRYADDWVIGVIGPLSLAQNLKNDVKIFLKDELLLELNEDKTFITHIPSRKAKFLGVEFFILRRSCSPYIVRKLSNHGKLIYSRINNIHFHLPYRQIIKSLTDKGFIKVKFVNLKKILMPFAITKWIFLDHRSILVKYNSVNNGLHNYFHFVDNIAKFGKIQYFIHHSCAKTIARKYRLRSRAATFKKFGKFLATPKSMSPELPQVKIQNLWLLQIYSQWSQ